MKKSLEEKKKQALEDYKKAKAKLTFEDLTKITPKWIEFCEAQKICIYLGVRI